MYIIVCLPLSFAIVLVALVIAVIGSAMVHRVCATTWYVIINSTEYKYSCSWTNPKHNFPSI